MLLSCGEDIIRAAVKEYIVVFPNGSQKHVVKRDPRYLTKRFEGLLCSKISLNSSRKFGEAAWLIGNPIALRYCIPRLVLHEQYRKGEQLFKHSLHSGAGNHLVN